MNKIFNDCLSDDIIEKFEVKKDKPGVGKVHHLPHCPVITSDHETTSFDSLVEDLYYETDTKKNVLKFSASLFDQLGLASPSILPSKVSFQKLCKDKTHWDCLVSESIEKHWIKFLNDLKTIKSVTIERYLFRCEASGKQLHVFIDSSGIAYSAVVFVRSVCEHGVKVWLWCAETRLVRCKEENKPRLELLGVCCYQN